MSLTNQLKKTTLRTAFNYLEKNPEENALKLMTWVDKLAGDGPDSFYSQRATIRQILEDPQNNMYQLAMSVMKETDPEVLKATFENFFLNASIIGWPIQEEYRRKYNCNIPWAILIDPTSACNLHCTGCWAAEYGNKLNLSLDEIDSVISQGKKLGIYMYIYAGGEPLVRKKDVIALCEKHSDCQFLAFTNSTLIDEDFADEMLRVKNFIPAISIEGFESATDSRRGDGTYRKAVHAMTILKEKRLPFGLSCCYTSQNLDSISSHEFIEQMVQWGARFVWYFHYMPVGNDAAPELLPSPEQRKFMYHRIREIRATQPIFALDFQNDGEFVGGCIAGGRRYLHINANGDCDPCVFIHYSNANIRDMSLLDVLKSPIFMAYHDAQPFNDNHLRPCPMLENPEMLREMVKTTGAHSTDLQSPETADHLCDKCEEYAKNWMPTANELWENSCIQKTGETAK
ncbi:MAG: radical SAM protein [Peptoniphilaceae bacterium]|nr:radical SAM protein [Peptoniphilaceae bacterium]MDY5765404.1 radical SAM protein [Peptoniphilaceae bacterium]